MVLIICSLSYIATAAVLSWKWKLLPYDIICLLKWKLKRWIVKRGKTIKKPSHCSSTKLIPCCLTKYLLLGGSGLEAWKRTSSPNDSPNEVLFYMLSVISTFICFWCSLGCPVGTTSFVVHTPPRDTPTHFGVSIGHILSFQLRTCRRTQPAWLDYQSMSKKAVGRKTSIASWGKSRSEGNSNKVLG